MKINPNILKQTSNDPYKYVPKKFIEVAEGLETQFLNHLLKQMQATTGESTESTAENFYKDLQTDERSKMISKTTSSGSLKDLILNQIYPEQYRNELTYNSILQQQEARKIYKSNIEIKE